MNAEPQFFQINNHGKRLLFEWNQKTSFPFQLIFFILISITLHLPVWLFFELKAPEKIDLNPSSAVISLANFIPSTLLDTKTELFNPHSSSLPPPSIPFIAQYQPSFDHMKTPLDDPPIITPRFSLSKKDNLLFYHFLRKRKSADSPLTKEVKVQFIFTGGIYDINHSGLPPIDWQRAALLSPSFLILCWKDGSPLSVTLESSSNSESFDQLLENYLRNSSFKSRQGNHEFFFGWGTLNPIYSP